MAHTITYPPYLPHSVVDPANAAHRLLHFAPRPLPSARHFFMYVRTSETPASSSSGTNQQSAIRPWELWCLGQFEALPPFKHVCTEYSAAKPRPGPGPAAGPKPRLQRVMVCWVRLFSLLPPTSAAGSCMYVCMYASALPAPCAVHHASCSPPFVRVTTTRLEREDELRRGRVDRQAQTRKQQPSVADTYKGRHCTDRPYVCVL